MKLNRTEGRTADAVHQVPELLGVVQHLGALGVRVVAHRERPRDGGREFPAERGVLISSAQPAGFKPLPPAVSPHFLLGVLKAVGDEVERLELGDGVLLQAGLVRIEGQQLRLVRQAVLKDPDTLMHFSSSSQETNGTAPHLQLSKR